MKILLQILGLSFLLLFFSCEKNDDPIKIDSIVAGDWDSNFDYYPFSPALELNPVWESNHWVANADTSFYIPLGQDSIPFRLSIKYINNDSLQSIQNKDSSIFQNLQIYAFDNMGFHLTKKTYYVGLGGTTDMYTVTAYHSGDIIKGIKSEFSFSNNEYHRWKPLWDMSIPLQGTITGYDGGQWYSLNNVQYIGFMYNNRLGWFKVDCTNHNYPKLISCAIKK
ncbi:MAG: hypothetical protein DSY76_01355 [Bacteroidetes bacterium]|nr:MAG: hypothetical protein DSY76_01355 [Bacteroidota bacterium]